MTKVVKHNSMRSTNTLALFECIRKHGPITKKEIQQHTGLSWGSISTIALELISKKLIVEIKSNESMVGRTPCLLDISNTDNFIIGVDVNLSGLTAALIDLKCRVIKQVREEMFSPNRTNILTKIKLMISQLIASVDDKKKIKGIGLAMPGDIDIQNGISVFVPHFEDFSQVPVKQILGEEFGIEVMIEHDPNCMALTERYMGLAQNVNNFMFIRLSMGIGMSIIFDGKIYRGLNGSAGQFGHITMNPDGPRCSCGNYGCLETYASCETILRKSREGLKMGRAPVLETLLAQGDRLNLATIAKAARGADEFILGIFDDAATYLGIAIANVVNIFNPELIILGGDLMNYQDVFLSKMKRFVDFKCWKNAKHPIEVSTFGSEAAAIGAALLFSDKIYQNAVESESSLPIRQ